MTRCLAVNKSGLYAMVPTVSINIGRFTGRYTEHYTGSSLSIRNYVKELRDCGIYIIGTNNRASN